MLLGRFLELALVVDDTGAAWQRYQQLGFTEALAGDVWSHAYGVVACGDFSLGLHGRGDEPLSLVFVRPEVALLQRELAALGHVTQYARLGSDVFNELALREPGGMLVRVLEARSFSPPAQLPESTLLGSFQRLSLPCRDLHRAEAFWQQLGVQTLPMQDPWDGFTLAGTPLACHARRDFPETALVFRHPAAPADFPATTTLQREAHLPSLVQREHYLLRTAEDLACIVLV